jgi:hypothetical protein
MNPIEALLSGQDSLGGGDINAIPRVPNTRMADPEQEAWKKRHSGIAGTARDILGGLGDFLLTRLHMKPMYSESKKRHQLNYAAQGMESDDPQEALRAINEVQKVDFEAGTKLREQYIDNQRLAAAQASTAESRAARIALAQEAQNGKTRGYAASMLGSMASRGEEERKALYPRMREQILLASKRQGLDLGAELPEQYDSVALDAFIDGAVPVGTQRAQRLTSERQAETGRHNVVTEGQGDRRLVETNRHNTRTEGQGDARIAQAGQRIAISGKRASGGGRPRADKPLSVVYTGDDGHKYVERSDGRVLRSSRPVKAGGAAKPAEGMRRVINGKTYVWKGGRAVPE